MHVGMTFDLRSEYLAAGYSEEETAEFDRPDTILAIEAALYELGHTTDRIGNVRQLVARLARGDRWDLVFNIAEGLYGTAREAQVPALLDAYEIPYTFADPLVLAVTLDKALAKLVVRQSGIPTPDFAVVRTSGDLAAAAALPLPLFVKPLAEGTGKGVTPASKVGDLPSLAKIVDSLLERFPQGVLVETYLPGREFTTALLGSGEAARVIGTLEIGLRAEAESSAYTYVNKEYCEELVDYRLARPSEDHEVRRAEAVALAAWRALGCRDAGRVDVRSDGRGVPHFLEVNPLAGLHPQHSDLPMICTAVGKPYVELIGDIVASAVARTADRMSLARASGIAGYASGGAT